MAHHPSCTRLHLNPHAAKANRLTPWWALSLLAAAIGSAYAQPAPSTGAADKKAEDSATSLETVTISATRRRELIREVPLSVTSIPAERLQEAGAKSLNDYLVGVAGVVQQNSGGGDNAGSIVIRGLTIGAENSPTTVYVDDTPLGLGTSFDVNLLDLRRFELLRGPQGTLYGSSAMGGIVKFVTSDPDTYGFSGRVGLGLSQTSKGSLNTTVNGMLNVPLSKDVAAFRVAAFDTREGGYVDATGPAAKDRVNRKDSNGARISLLVTPSRDLSIKLSALTQTRNSDGGDKIVVNPQTRQPVAGDLVFPDLQLAEPRKGERQLYTATVEYDLKWARLSSITSKQKAKDTSTTDFSSIFALFPFGIQTAAIAVKSDNDKTTQEFRLVSQQAGAVEWLVGAFFDRVDFAQTSVTTGTNAGGPFPGALDISGGLRDYKESAVYGNATWNLTPAFAVTAGLRAARYKQADTVQQDGLFNGGKQPDRTLNFSETPKTYLLTAKYRLTPQSNVYVRAASGYRAGGANFGAVDPISGNTLPGAQPSYGTDKVWSYEAGYKANFPDSRATFEIVAFDTEWKDLQQTTSVNGVGFTSNLGKARVRGLEASGSFSPATSLALGLALSLLDPKLLTDSPGLQAKAGDRLPYSPKFAATLTSRYSFDLVRNPAFAGLNISYQGDRNSSFPGGVSNPNYVMPAFAQFDLIGGVDFKGYGLGFFVRNLTDKRGQYGAYTSEAALGGRTYVRVIEPRTIGVNLSASF